MGPFSRRKKGDGDKNEERGDASLSLQPQDVLVGRGKGAYLSEGNKRYMLLVNQFLPVYRRATNNQEKIEITKAVVAHVKRTGGRFMGVDNKGNLYIVTDHVARIKVGQAIRRRRRQVDGEMSESEWIGSTASQQTESERNLASQRSVDAGGRAAATVSIRSNAEESYRSVNDHDSYRSDGASYRSIGASQRSYAERTTEDASPYVPRGTAAASYENLASGLWDNTWSLERTFEDDDEEEDESPYIPRGTAATMQQQLLQQEREQQNQISARTATEASLVPSTDDLLTQMPNMSLSDTIDPSMADALEPTPIAPTHQHVQQQQQPIEPIDAGIGQPQQIQQQQSIQPIDVGIGQPQQIQQQQPIQPIDTGIGQQQQQQNFLSAQQQALALQQQQQQAAILSSGMQQPMGSSLSFNNEPVPLVSASDNPAIIQSQMGGLATNQQAVDLALRASLQQQQQQQQSQINQQLPLGPGVNLQNFAGNIQGAG